MRNQFKETDYIGKTYNYLTILKFTRLSRVSTGQITRHCLCRCRCGKEKEYALNNILGARSKSCGCMPYSCHNPYFKTRLYRIYQGMKTRCYKESHPAYRYYGAKGVKVCKTWKNNFQSFYNWAINNGYKENLSIDRINPCGNYTPSNCRWATSKQQANNKRLSNRLNIKKLSDKTGYSMERIRQLANVGFFKGYVHRRSVDKNKHYFFKDEAVGLLRQKRLLCPQYRNRAVSN
jgi:hypothetical protein